MKKLIISLILLQLGFTSLAQSKEEKAVEAAAAFLVKALESGKKSDLEWIASDKLSYGHSNGLVEDKKAFVEALTNGQSNFVTINISNQTISVVDDHTLVRHRLDGSTLNKGVQGEIHLHVLLIFKKEKGEWKLLARQATKVS
jgi:hypothetical protein